MAFYVGQKAISWPFDPHKGEFLKTLACIAR